jgi:hypothetical protein
MSSDPGAPIQRRHGTTTTAKEWVEQITTVNQINLQQKIIGFLLKAYGGLLAATMLIFFLQGFKVAGFTLDAALLKWLGGATIGEIAGLLTLTFSAVFKQRKDSV